MNKKKISNTNTVLLLSLSAFVLVGNLVYLLWANRGQASLPAEGAQVVQFCLAGKPVSRLSTKAT